MSAATGTVSKLFSSSSLPFSFPFPLSPKKSSLSLLSSQNPPISFLSSLSFPKLTPLKSSANTTQHFEEEEVEEEEEEEEDIVSETEIDEYESDIDIEDLEKEAKFAVKELSTSLSRQLTIGAAFPSFLPSMSLSLQFSNKYHILIL
jgi:GTP-binding protein